MENLPIAFLTRLTDNGVQTLGNLTVFNGNRKLFECVTLELPWKQNKRRESCIPAGQYVCLPHNSPKFGASLWVQGVKGRSEILIHPANSHDQLLGCIAPGLAFAQLRGDAQLDVTHSRVTMGRLLKFCQKGLRLVIVDWKPETDTSDANA